MPRRHIRPGRALLTAAHPGAPWHSPASIAAVKVTGSTAPPRIERTHIVTDSTQSAPEKPANCVSSRKPRLARLPCRASLGTYYWDVLTGLRLEPVTQENVRAACKLKIRPDQEDLVAPVAWSLADAYTVPDIAWPRLIYDDGQLVGFIMAAFFPEHQNALFHSYLWRLNIGAECQGKGYGRFAVEALCQEAMQRGKHRLTVSYHPYQHGPEGFYRRLGFQPTGEYNEDEVVAERILSAAAQHAESDHHG